MTAPLPSTLCSSCGARIVYAHAAKTGRLMPVDHEPDNVRGNVLLAVERGGVTAYLFGDAALATAAEQVLAEGEHRPMRDRHLSHFATCPQAAEHRTRR